MSSFKSKMHTIFSVWVWPCYLPLELEVNVIFIINFFGFSFYLLHNIIRTISSSSKMNLQTLLCQIYRIEHCVGSVTAEHSIEHSLLDSKLGGTASELEDKSRIKNYLDKQEKKKKHFSVKTSAKYHAFYNRSNQLQSRRWRMPVLACWICHSAVNRRKKNSKL